MASARRTGSGTVGSLSGEGSEAQRNENGQLTASVSAEGAALLLAVHSHAHFESICQQCRLLERLMRAATGEKRAESDGQRRRVSKDKRAGAGIKRAAASGVV